MTQICHIHVQMQTYWEPADDLRFHHWPDVLPKTTSGWLRVECLISGMLLIRTSFWVLHRVHSQVLKCFMCLWILKVGVSSGNRSQKQLVTFLFDAFFCGLFSGARALSFREWVMFQLYRISLESAFSKWDRAANPNFQRWLRWKPAPTIFGPQTKKGRETVMSLDPPGPIPYRKLTSIPL